MLKILSPAKVNLGLWIKGKRSDGYHDILTVFHAIDLCDEIIVREGPLKVKTSMGIPQEENLVYRALLEYRKITGLEVDFSIYINKRIPVGAGLGGGSSNAAVVLREVNRLLGNPLSPEELSEILSGISADSPFFLIGGTALAKGKGEVLKPLPHPQLTITLVIPEVGSNTGLVYSALRETEFGVPEEKELIDAIERGDFSFLENPLGKRAMEVYPQIGEVYRFLEFTGIKPLVSGSGSAVFYIGKADQKVIAGAKARGWKVFEVKSWPGV